ncbi:MAG TPA: lysylphosphatidylglycerol synthase transmembrane domain-containing protein [Bacteroidales bacterium]|nr:lysylphosphatidylglycerol synthase transmembrane domain-containing protein [Bacteroidales bacterium]
MDNPQKILRPGRIILPVLIGLSATVWLIYRNYERDTLGFFEWTWAAAAGLLMALAMMGVRDIAYMYRIRVLTGGQLTWRQSFQVIMLWEFSSAVSPSVVGGTGPAIWFLYKEGLNTGKSTAVVLTSIFLDEVFFVIMVPLLYFFFGHLIFPPELSEALSGGIKLALLLGYGLILLYTLMLTYTLFINPYFFKWLLSILFMLPLLRGWRMRMRKLANQLIITSNELRGQSFGYWAKAFLATVISWTGRYSVTNFIFMAFFFSHLSLTEHFLIYARQLTMWIILLVSPTPGGSGVAEIVFGDFLADLLPNAAWVVPLALLWRFISYYPYLIMGAFVLPNWISRVYQKPVYRKID